MRFRILVLERYFRTLRGNAGLLRQGTADASKQVQLIEFQLACHDVEQVLHRCLRLV